MTTYLFPATTVAATLVVGRSRILSPAETGSLRGARVLLDGVPATLRGVCSCGCDQRELQRSERYGVLVDLERFVVQTDDQVAERVSYTCVPASRLAAA